MMSDQNRSLLEEKCPALMRTVDLESSPLLANLVSKGTITTEQKDFIKEQGANFQQVETLIGTLLKKSDEDLDKFIVCLEDSGHSHVASDLRSLCREKASSTTRRQEKTVSVKVEVSAKFRSSPSSFGDKTKAESVGSNSSVSSDTGRTETQGNREPISPLGSEADKSTGKDNIGPHSSAASEVCQNKNKGSSLPESVLLKIFEENILDILRTKVEGLKKGHLDRAQTLPILVELSSMHREVVGVYQSSILFIVRCPSLAALYGLKKAKESGRLQDSFIRTFFTPERYAQFEIVSADVNMSLDEMEYTQCEQELIVAEMQKKRKKLEVRKDVDRPLPLDELAHKEDSSCHSQARKHATMERRFREALVKSRPALLKDLNVEAAVDHMLAKLVIFQEDSNKILAEKTDDDKRRVLLDLIQRCGQKAIPAFMEYLAGSLPWLHETIKDNLATTTQVEDVEKFWKQQIASSEEEEESKALQVNEIHSCSQDVYENPENEFKNITVGKVETGRPEYFDAFVCFTYKDLNFVKQMIHMLEGVHGLKLCVDVRDLLPGTSQHTVTAKLIEERCRKMLVILSPNFILSPACDFQAKLAHSLSPGSRSKKLVPILIEPCTLPNILRHITLVDYTKYDLLEWFWMRLAYLLKEPVAIDNTTKNTPLEIPPQLPDVHMKELMEERQRSALGPGSSRCSSSNIPVRPGMRSATLQLPSFTGESDTDSASIASMDTSSFSSSGSGSQSYSPEQPSGLSHGSTQGAVVVPSTSRHPQHSGAQQPQYPGAQPQARMQNVGGANAKQSQSVFYQNLPENSQQLPQFPTPTPPDPMETAQRYNLPVFPMPTASTVTHQQQQTHVVEQPGVPQPLPCKGKRQ